MERLGSARIHTCAGLVTPLAESATLRGSTPGGIDVDQPGHFSGDLTIKQGSRAEAAQNSH